jgi:hypothetical protein
MGAALALAVMLVVVVAIMSLAVNAQGPFQATGQGAQRAGPARTPAPGPPAPEHRRQAPPDQPRRAPRDKTERSRERRGASPPVEVPAEPAPVADPLAPLADVRPLDTEATATVISVVDERTLGPVTRSRLSLRVHPPSGDEFEVTTRVAFPTPEARAKVKVGSTIAVRYDQDDRRRVVVDMERDG